MGKNGAWFVQKAFFSERWWIQWLCTEARRIVGASLSLNRQIFADTCQLPFHQFVATATFRLLEAHEQGVHETRERSSGGGEHACMAGFRWFSKWAKAIFGGEATAHP